ncbi:hypothetical protein HZ326_1219 [Fusarium oxysporum f. sp. albedinis]|nr:hypothetical protein HZ326_1219 [Fusarium oxysporum f. sp. albedinis]
MYSTLNGYTARQRQIQFSGFCLFIMGSPRTWGNAVIYQCSPALYSCIGVGCSESLISRKQITEILFLRLAYKHRP